MTTPAQRRATGAEIDLVTTPVPAICGRLPEIHVTRFEAVLRVTLSKMITDTPANDLETQDAAGAFRESFESFYAREVRKLIGLAYVLSGSRLAAEDLAQDALLAAYRDWERVGRYDNPGAWVRRVVSNRAVSRLRRRTSEAKAVLRMQRDEYTVPEIDAGAIHLWDEVRRLPSRQAQAVALRYFDRGTIAEIASILDCSENTVKTHLRRAKETLQRRLTEELKS